MDKNEKQPAHHIRLSPLLATIGVIVIFFVAQALAVNVMVLFGAAQGKTENQIIDWISDSVLIQSVTLLLVTIIGMSLINWLLKLTGTNWAAIGFKKFELKDVGRAIIGYGWYFLLFFIIMTLISQFVVGVDLDQQQQLGFDRESSGALVLLLTGFSLVILPAIYEEVLMRGVLFTGIRSRLSFVATAIIVSIIFAAAHLEWGSGSALNWAAAIDTGILSLVLVYLREKSQSLWPAIILHGIKNLIAFTLVFVLKLA